MIQREKKAPRKRTSAPNASTSVLSNSSTLLSSHSLNSQNSQSSKVRRRKRTKVIEHPRSSDLIFSNREIGWLNFNLRVLAEAEDSQNPLFERIKFLSISCSNLDEFFMKRVGGLKRHLAYGVSAKSSDGQTPEMQMNLIMKRLPSMLKKQKDLYHVLLKDLEVAGFEIVGIKDLKEAETKLAKSYFLQNVFPVLTPLSVDPGHPFPFISNLSTSLGISLVNPNHPDEKLFARVKIPKVINQWLHIEGTKKWIHVVELIRSCLDDLFPSMKVLGHVLFRVSRNADSDREEEDAEDLLAMIEEELRQRRFAEIVRIEFGECTDSWLKDFLMSELGLKSEDLFPMPAEFDLNDFALLTQQINKAEYRYKTWSPVLPSALGDGSISIFEAIRRNDILLHHPFESFSLSVERFIREAASDPDVLAIKMTLYRTGDNSPFVKALIQAAEAGKQVVCLIELKARFDEERNIYWAQELENSGVHVVYGLVGLKTHAKTSLVVRKEFDAVRCYAHVGTGNYNSATARFYTDLGLLTCDNRITQELLEFFNYLTGKSLKQDYKHLILAPVNMFGKMKELILRERDHVKLGKPSLIIAKFNNMEENDISLALYEASQGDVSIHLIVRGFCCIRPQVKGLSQNIRVQSTVGRFLEHSRLFYFRNGQQDPIDGDFFIGSADWMYRNLHARVEAMCPIYDRAAKEKLWVILQLYLNDRAQSWDMKDDATYERRVVNSTASREKPALRVQDELMRTTAGTQQAMTEDDLVYAGHSVSQPTTRPPSK